MYRLSSIIIAVLMFTSSFGQSPHGDELKVSCNQCHNPSGWELDIYLMRFDHSKTDFKLEGAHTQTDCKACHETLVFNEAPNQCASCHNDIHSSSVGNDCARCHTSNTWLVDNIPEIHEENGFPLVGSHGNLSCVDCHFSDTNLRFDNVGNDCISCHREDYLAADSPDHTNFSTDCLECHTPIGDGWDTDNIGNHDFFPLTLGHDNLDCTQCHNTGNFSDADPNCVTCHQADYDGTTSPNHSNTGFSTDCASCHTTNPGWTPANINHDFFPLTLGHDIKDCTQCHLTANYSDADPNCVTCHQTDYDGTTNPNHSNTGFSTDCASCHSTNPGWTPATINHDFFPLTLGHDIQD
ncbi:MAG: cytochrome c3 family protein, partial [Flavobacteriaceae bacterium]